MNNGFDSSEKMEFQKPYAARMGVEGFDAK